MRSRLFQNVLVEKQNCRQCLTLRECCHVLLNSQTDQKSVNIVFRKLAGMLVAQNLDDAAVKAERWLVGKQVQGRSTLADGCGHDDGPMERIFWLSTNLSLVNSGHYIVGDSTLNGPGGDSRRILASPARVKCDGDRIESVSIALPMYSVDACPRRPRPSVRKVAVGRPPALALSCLSLSSLAVWLPSVGPTRRSSFRLGPGGDLWAHARSRLTELPELWNLPKEAFKSPDTPRVEQSIR